MGPSASTPASLATVVTTTTTKQRPRRTIGVSGGSRLVLILTVICGVMIAFQWHNQSTWKSAVQSSLSSPYLYSFSSSNRNCHKKHKQRKRNDDDDDDKDDDGENDDDRDDHDDGEDNDDDKDDENDDDENDDDENDDDENDDEKNDDDENDNEKNDDEKNDDENDDDDDDDDDGERLLSNKILQNQKQKQRLKNSNEDDSLAAKKDNDVTWEAWIARPKTSQSCFYVEDVCHSATRWFYKQQPSSTNETNTKSTIYKRQPMVTLKKESGVSQENLWHQQSGYPMEVNIQHYLPNVTESLRCYDSTIPNHLVLFSSYNHMLGEFYDRGIRPFYNLFLVSGGVVGSERDPQKYDEDAFLMDDLSRRFLADTQLYIHLEDPRSQASRFMDSHFLFSQIVREANPLLDFRTLLFDTNCACMKRLLFCGYKVRQEKLKESYSSAYISVQSQDTTANQPRRKKKRHKRKIQSAKSVAAARRLQNKELNDNNGKANNDRDSSSTSSVVKGTGKTEPTQQETTSATPGKQSVDGDANLDDILKSNATLAGRRHRDLKQKGDKGSDVVIVDNVEVADAATNVVDAKVSTTAEDPNSWKLREMLTTRYILEPLDLTNVGYLRGKDKKEYARLRNALRHKLIYNNPFVQTDIQYHRTTLFQYHLKTWDKLPSEEQEEWKIIGLTQRSLRRRWQNINEAKSKIQDYLLPHKMLVVIVNVEESDWNPYTQLIRHAALDALIGIHGAQLTEAIWMPKPGSLVVELLPYIPGDLLGQWVKSTNGPTPLGVIFRETDLNHVGYPLQRDSAPYCTSEEEEHANNYKCWREVDHRWDERDFTVPALKLAKIVQSLMAIDRTKTSISNTSVSPSSGAVDPEGRQQEPVVAALCQDYVDAAKDNVVLYNVNCRDNPNAPIQPHHFYWPN